MASFTSQRRISAKIEIPSCYKDKLERVEQRSGKLPSGALELEWVYGFETEVISGRNLQVLPGDRGVLYAAAAVIVIYQVNRCRQRHYLGHCGRRVLSVALRKEDDKILLCASGERAAKPRILIWNVDTLETIYSLGETFFKGGVISVFFVQENALVSVDASATHSLGYWRIDELNKSASLVEKRTNANQQDAAESRRAHWGGATECDIHRQVHIDRQNFPMAEARADRAAKPPSVYDGCATGSDKTFCTVGPGRHLKFWTASFDEKANKWKLNFETARWIGIPESSSASKSATMRRCLCLSSVQVLITASDDGFCRAWRNRVAFATFAITPQRPIFALSPVPGDDTAFLTGDATGIVRLWKLRDQNNKSIVIALLPQSKRGGVVAKEMNLQQESPSLQQCTKRPYIHDLVCLSDNVLFAATKRGVLWMLEQESAGQICVTALAASHFALNSTTTLRGVALLASTNRVVTAGGDGLLCIYNVHSHRLESWIRLDGPADCCDVIENRKLIVVGLESTNEKLGGVSCHDAETLILQRRLSTDGIPVDCIRLCDRFLVAATRDGRVRIANHNSSIWNYCWRPQYGNSRLIQIDIEPRNICLRLTTSDRQLLFFDVKAKRQCGDDWHGQSYPGLNSTVGFHLLGAVDPDAKRLDPNKHYHVTAAHVLDADDLLAVGDADGGIRVLNAPCIAPKASGLRAIAHGSAIAAMKWSDSILVTVGGGDRTLMQWKFTRTEAPSISLAKEEAILSVPDEKNDKSSKPSQQKERIKTICVICYLCGSLNPARSVDRHIRACQKKWQNAHNAANIGDINDPGPLPPDPYPDFDYTTLNSSKLARLNEEIEAHYRAHVLRGCNHCGRRFTRLQLSKHQVSCSVSKPFKPPIGRRMPLAEENKSSGRKD